MSSSVTPFTEIASNGKKMRFANKSKEKHLIAAVVILAFVLVSFVIAVIVLALQGKMKDKKLSEHDVCTTVGCVGTAYELLNTMDLNADPCEDFNQFACGKWPSSLQVYGDSKLAFVGIKNILDINEHLIKAATEPSFPESVRKIGNAYITCGKYGDLRDADASWLLQTINYVGGWPMADDNWKETQYPWERNLAMAIRHLIVQTPLYLTVDINFFDTRKHIIHIHQHELESLQSLDKEKILAVAKRIGNRDNDALLEKEYQEMEAFAELLKKMSRSTSDLLDDPNGRKQTTIKELQKEIPWINWLEFLRIIFGSYLRSSLSDSEPVILFGPKYISRFLQLALNETISRRTLANYIAASFVQHLISLNPNVGTQSSLLSPKDLVNIHPPQGLSDSCLTFLSRKANYAVDFVHYKNKKTKLVDSKTLDYFFKAMKEIIKKASWLDETTRAAAIEKLEAIIYFIGYPERIKDHRKIEEFFRGLPNMTGNSVRNLLEIERHFFKREVEYLRRNVDRKSWPTTVGAEASRTNAFNDPDLNIIAILAGIQSKPLYDPSAPNYWNFGCFGWVIAHEITHSFDTSGSKRDKYGNMKNWWMPKSKEEFEKRSKCFIEQYNKFDFGYKDHHVNGTVTLAENIADNGGMRQAYLAYKLWEKDNGKEKSLPGLEKYNSHQLFFISAAQSYCGTPISPEELYQSALHDVHSPNKFRYNGAAANLEDFAKAFNCNPGRKMNPVKKCIIW